jgi:hypothetical protein
LAAAAGRLGLQNLSFSAPSFSSETRFNYSLQRLSMPGSTTSDQKTIPPHHEDFHWINGPGRDGKFADFIELTRDISAGIAPS